jgi:integrase
MKNQRPREAGTPNAGRTLHGCLLDVAAGTGAALNLPNATWLTFRRTDASWAHDKGVPGKVVAHLMGHTNADVTLNVYTEVLMHRSAQRSIASVANCSRWFTNRERGRR